MDVRCERCNTEYEFDDALVSGRGTTVKCTNCGHKFKIRRSQADYAEDYWNVEASDGRMLVFTSLRELQRAIQSRVVKRNDRLSRGGLPPKPIGQIPELAPFFEGNEGARASVPHAGPGGGPPPLPRPRSSHPPLPPPRQRQSTQPDFPGPPSLPLASMKQTLIGGTGSDRAVAKAPERPTPPPNARSTALMGSGPGHTKSVPPPLPKPTPVLETSALSPPPPRPLPPPPRPPPAARVESAEVTSPLPPPVRPMRSLVSELEDGDDDDRERAFSDAPPPPRRRSVGGFIVASVVALGVALLAVVWAKENLGPTFGAKAPASASAAVDPRVADFLSAGERALADGNHERAKENFDKASALAEKDPRLLVDMARLAAARADVHWLEMRLLPETPGEPREIAGRNLADRADHARQAADDALAVAPEEVDALRAKIDALRISGDSAGARALVAKIVNASAAQPETAYVLAALDLADADPLWPTVIQRLRVAAGGESGPGRGRAALVYALARSGDFEGAKAEIDRLSSMPRQHALLPALRAFVERARGAKSDAGVVDAGPVKAVAIEPAPPPPPQVAERPTAPGAPAVDPRALVQQAETARKKGEYERARSLYSAALEKDPNNSEALNGIADISHAQRDLNNARASYKRVLSINPVYLPALVGLGDVDWEAGDRASAVKTYKDIVDRFPEGSYPVRVKQRLEAGGAPAKPAEDESG